MAIAGLILGILGLLLSWIPFVGWLGVLLALIGVGLGLGGMKAKRGLGMAAAIIAAAGLAIGLYIQIKSVLAAKEAVNQISAELDKPENKKAFEELKAAANAAAAEPAKAAAPVEVKEIDLSAFGPSFKGYVAMAPSTSKVEFDDPSRFLHISELDYLKLSEAPFFADGIASLSKDPDNKNIVKLGELGATYERNPPLGKQWCFDYQVKIGADAWSCSAESFTSAEVAKQLLEICKSIKKK